MNFVPKTIFSLGPVSFFIEQVVFELDGIKVKGVPYIFMISMSGPSTSHISNITHISSFTYHHHYHNRYHPTPPFNSPFD